MKKLTYIAVAILLLTVSLPTGAQHRIGIINGLNFTDLDIKNANLNFSGRTVFGIGCVLDLYLNEKFILHLEPMFIQKGGITKVGVVELLDFGIDITLKSSFLEIPVFLKTEFGSTIKPYVMAGPTIGFLLNSGIEAEFAGFNLELDMKDVTKSIDFGFGFGGGISFPIGKASLFLESCYTFGLSNMRKDGTVGIPALPMTGELDFDLEGIDIKYKNRGLKIMLGVTYPFTK